MASGVMFLVMLILPAGLAFSQPKASEGASHEHIRYLVLDRSWPVQRLRFYPGQSLMFKLKDEPGWHRGRIQAVHKNHLTILDANIPFSEIRKIKVRNQGYWAGFAANTSGSLLGGGAVLLLAGSINAIENRNGEKGTIAYAGAGAIVLGSALRVFAKRTYRVGGNRRLRSI